jgi:hypothetical protein
MTLAAFVRKNYADFRIIGENDPAIIITSNGVNYVIYRVFGEKNGRYKVCQGEKHQYFTEFNQLLKIVKNENVLRKENPVEG